MSSILEALRELETRRPPAAQSVAAPPEEPAARHRAIEMIGIASIGLLIGGVGFVVLLGVTELVGKTVGTDAAPTTPDAPTAAAPTAAAPPTWLGRAEPPRARVDAKSRGGETAPTERPVRQRASETSGGGRLGVVGIEYSARAPERVVALRFDDDAVVRLHERESARGLEVQLIQADGAYVKRGSEVFLLPAPR